MSAAEPLYFCDDTERETGREGDGSHEWRGGSRRYSVSPEMCFADVIGTAVNNFLPRTDWPRH